MKQLFISLFVLIIILSACTKTQPVLKIGLVADPQYADKTTAGQRYYRESLWKLKEAIDTFNHNGIDFVQNLGDIIDANWESYDSIIPIYESLNREIENYHLLGNHEFSLDSSRFTDLLETLSMPDYYYSYVRKGWRFVVLDATDYAYFSNSLHHHDINKVAAYYSHTIGQSNNHRWNSAVGEKQQQWLKGELNKAKLLNEKVIIFSHAPIRPIGDPHNLWNDHEIIDIIENNSTVVAFINGHNHAGGHVYKNGIHYITIFGMVDTVISSYGILEIFKDRLILRGYGNQKDIILME